MVKPRPSAEVGDIRALARMFQWADDADDFCQDWFGDRLFASRAAAERAWCLPGVRREVWAHEHRMRVPRPAVVFDHLTAVGWQTLWDTLDDDAYALPAVLAALAKDRRAVGTFHRQDPHGAAAISDYLDMWCADLDAVATVARDVARADPLSRRSYYRELTSGRMYGAPEA